MAGQDRRHNAHKMSKKKQAKAQAGLFARFKKALGLDTIDEGAVQAPREKIYRSKYTPHQGAQEKARRVDKGLANMNANVFAKPSQDFSKSHFNNAALRAIIEEGLTHEQGH